MANMQLKRFTCQHKCKSSDSCGGLPLELHRDKKGIVDILFLTEFPGKNEIHGKQFLSTESRHGNVFRIILDRIEDKFGTDWSYGITGLFKSTLKEEVIKGKGNQKDKKYALNAKDMFHCANEVATKEIEFCNPKLVVALGEYAFKFLFGYPPKYGMLMENNKFYHNIKICGEKRSVLCLMHPTWGVRNGGDGCTIGYLYEGIHRAVDFILNDIDYHIPDTFKTKLLTDYDDVKHVLKKMRHTPEIIGVDTETDNLNRVYDNNILSLQLSVDGKIGYVIPLDHYESPFKGNNKIKKLLHNFFTKPEAQTKGYVFVNCKFDYHQMFRSFNTLEINAPLLDCSFAEYSLDENWVRIHGFPAQKGNFSLFALAYKRNFNYYAESDMKEQRANLSHLPLSKWTKYGGADVVAPWQIFKTQMLQASRHDYLDGFKKMNLVFLQHLIRSCMYCEHTGISINFKQLENLYSHEGVFATAIKDIVNEFYKSENVKKANDILIKQKNGMSGTGLFGETRLFNPSKNLQRDLLYFQVMGLEPVEDDDDEDKEGGSTGKQFQKQYRDAYPEVSLLEQFNSLNKMKTGFVNPVYDWMSPKSPNRLPDFKDFRARSNFSYLTVTGRLRSYSPNAQQRPSHSKYTKDILTMYTPPKGRCLIKLDYVTFEVKGLGFISRDKAMVKSFNEMHELKRQYREDPTCFFEQGYEIENKNLKKHRKELKERKEKLEILKEASPKDYKEAKEKFDKELKEYKEAKEKFERLCEERPQEISHNYLVFQTDFHRRSASLFNSIPIEEVTKPMRQNAKGLVFGCLVSKTIISTKYGLYRVEELENHNYKVQSINRKIVNSDGIVCKGEKPVVRVLTRQAALTGTSGHHVLTVNSECKLKMKPLGKLQKGDLVVYQKGVFGNIIPKLGKKEISIEDAEAMGLFTGDGSASQPGKSARLLYGSVDKTEITRFRNFVYKWSGIKGEIKLEHNEGSFAKEAGDDDRWIYRMGVTDKNTWVKLNNFGLLGRQEIRRVPPQILRAKPEYVAAYLRGYFDADGGIRKSSRGYKQLFLNSMNVELLTDVVMLLNLFDISSSIYRGSHPDHKNGEFELVITSSTSIIRFYKNIGFGTKIKQKKLEKYVKYIKKTATRKLAIDKVNYPMSHHSVLQKYAMKAGVKTFRSRPIYVNDILIKPLAHKPIQNTINNIDEYKESFYALGMKDEWKCLKLLSNPDVCLNPVFEEPFECGIEPVYDVINVDKYNKWVANGVVVSNSIYGRGIPSIAKELKIEEEEAQRYFDLFMANMPQAAQWLKDQPVFGKKNLYVDSPLGRRRRLWGYLMGNKSFDAKMDRYSDNSVIQGSCSDFQLLGTSMSLTMIQKHGRALGQCDNKDVWLETNMIHDSCEFEFPLIDAYYALLTFEELYTNLLERYIHKVFGFRIDVPLEVDFTVGSSYANTEDWDGSKLHAKELMKKLCKDCGERDGVDYSDIYKKAIHHPYFKEYKGIARETCDEWIKRSKKDLKYNEF